MEETKTLEAQRFNRLLYRIGGFLAFLISFIIYARTAQVTTSFWDCGEFISTSYILGVPHPPGAPLMNLIYRLAGILPIPGEVAFRVNLASGFFNSIGVGLLFVIIAKVITRWFIKVKDLSDISIVFSGAFVGSLLTAFSNTYWFNSVEAEVYGPAMFLTNLVVLLAMIWSEHHDNPRSDRYMVLIALVFYLAISVHLTVLIMLPPLFLFFIIVDKQKRWDPLFWFTWLVLFSFAIGFQAFVWFFGIGIVVTLIGSLVTRKKNWILALATIAVSLTAFSVNSYTLIRARAHPEINENDPSTLEDFQDYINRKQYGSKSMWEKMFTRRAKWSNQFGNHPRMGFWGFYRTQYTKEPGGFLYTLVPFLFALFGVAFAIIKNPRWGILLLMTVLVGTVGLILYINFADGTVPPDHLEVRDRDYFFTPGYMYMSALTGIGLAALLFLFNELRRKAKMPAFFTVILGVLFLTIPYKPLKENYYTHDRSRNWIPRDYAYNILMSVEENGILFTNGDNDTFPLWFLQTVEGVRRDVRVANLSLLNTPWYIDQLKNQMNVPITMSDDQIQRLHAYRDGNTGEIVRVQDVMIDHIIRNTDLVMQPDSSLEIEPPIYFAVTVAPDNKGGYDDYLEMNGLAYKLTTTKGDRKVDVPLMKENLYQTYKYRGLSDTTIYKDENAAKLTQNYITAFMTLSMELSDRGDTSGAIEAMEFAIENLPYKWELHAFAGDVYSRYGMVDKIEELYEMAQVKEPSNQRYIAMFAHFFRRLDQEDRALKILEESYAKNLDDRDFMMDLVRMYYMMDKRDEMDSVLRDWQTRHPDDKEFQRMIRQPATSTNQVRVQNPTDAAGNPKIMTVPSNPSKP